MEHSQISFVPLLTVILLAFLVPLLLSRIRRVQIPIVVGEIIAGIIVGQSGFGLVEETAGLRLLSELGFAFLMFLSGLEIDFSSVLGDDDGKGGETGKARRIASNPLVVGSVLFALTLLGSGLAAFLLAGQGLVNDAWIMALILSTTSLGVVVPVLKERGLAAEPYGQYLLVAALVADFASILLISIYVLLRSQGLTGEILLVLALFAAFVAVYRLASLSREHLPAERIFEELSTATSQIKTRGALGPGIGAGIHRPGRRAGHRDHPGGVSGRRHRLPAFRRREHSPAGEIGCHRLRLLHPHLFRHGRRPL